MGRNRQKNSYNRDICFAHSSQILTWGNLMVPPLECSFVHRAPLQRGKTNPSIPLPEIIYIKQFNVQYTMLLTIYYDTIICF